MNTMMAFAMGELNRHNEKKVFDWNKAAKLIKENYLDEVVFAGLSGDMEYTSGCIFRDGHPIHDDYTYLSSTWATPVLAVGNNIDGNYEEIQCYVMEHETEWDDSTKWPQSALDILGVKESQS